MAWSIYVRAWQRYVFALWRQLCYFILSFITSVLYGVL